jgi:hypothetical protein
MIDFGANQPVTADGKAGHNQFLQYLQQLAKLVKNNTGSGGGSTLIFGSRMTGNSSYTGGARV